MPAGKHAIEIAYEPKSWCLGVLISVLAAAGLLALGWRRPFGGSRDGPAAGSPGRLYGVDVSAMLFQLHEWDIHIVRRGTDDAGGAGGTGAADDPPHQAGNFRH